LVGHCTHTSGSANIKVQYIFNIRNNITCSTSCKSECCNTVYPRNMVCFRDIIVLNTLYKGDDDDHHHHHNNNNTYFTYLLTYLVTYSVEQSPS
jgi:hypothetical protein